ncbi:MAG: class I SAM-dependent methyltransferase [Thermoplasmata archaeon]
MTAYNQPLYYEIAFSFFDVEEQADLFERYIDQYSKIEVDRVLDIACGSSLQLRKLAKRGYECIGLDLSDEMLEYLSEKAEGEGVELDTVKADMIDFELDKKVDMAFMLMGTIGLIQSNEDFLSHLDSVADSLRNGGLYLIENLKLGWNSDDFFGKSEWTEKRDGIEVEATYSLELKDALEQKVLEKIILEVDDQGEKKTIVDERTEKLIFPQEFISLVNHNDRFEFVGWFKRYEIEPLKEAKNDNLVVLRKK